MEKTKVIIYSDNGVIPVYKTEGAAGFDLHAKFTNKISKISIEKIKDIELKRYISDVDAELEDLISPCTYQFLTESIFRESIHNAIQFIKPSDYEYLYLYLIELGIIELNIILPFSTNILPTNLYTQIPEGYEIQIRPRSGIGAKTNMIAHFGTIDSDYRGNIGIIINNPSPNSYLILPNERLAQGVFSKVDHLEWEIVNNIEDLTETNRGSGGFGSTGK